MTRREKSDRLLSAAGAKAPDASVLPVFDSDGASLRPLDSVVDRAIALYLTATYADVLLQQRCSRDESFAFANKFIQRYQAGPLFSGRERAFLAIAEPTTCQIGKFCWGWESLHFLLWAFGFIGDLGLPTEPVPPPKCSKVFNQNRLRQNVFERRCFGESMRWLMCSTLHDAANTAIRVVRKRGLTVGPCTDGSRLPNGCLCVMSRSIGTVFPKRTTTVSFVFVPVLTAIAGCRHAPLFRKRNCERPLFIRRHELPRRTNTSLFSFAPRP
jgi:hypothetical protein